jgi:hypothetical protein
MRVPQSQVVSLGVREQSQARHVPGTCPRVIAQTLAKLLQFTRDQRLRASVRRLLLAVFAERTQLAADTETAWNRAT